METRLVPAGPYRATRLWNEVTKYFRAGMPLRKHRQHFKKHGNCFTAAEAVDWLHELLKNNSNFGPEVTRQQTIQLLRKFLKNHVIEDIKGRWGSENLEDNNNLYRFPPTSPVKALPNWGPVRENTENFPKEKESLFKLPQFSRRTPKKNELLESLENIAKSEILEEANEHSVHAMEISQENIEEIWRNIILIHLQTILGLPSLEEVLHSTQIIPQDVIYNMTNTSKHGVVVLQNKSEDLPHWVLSAMKCLAYWPRSNDLSQPTYIGFERDVFRTVADYFLNLPEPLLTFEYYELFVNILVVCGYITIPNRSNGKHSSQDEAFAEIIVKPGPELHFGQGKPSPTVLATTVENDPGDSDITINKRLCKSTVELSENSFTSATFMLTGTQNLLQPHIERVAVEALQICCLLLPPPNRRRLQLLMRMISRISQNVDMPRLHDAMGTRSLMIQTFSRCVLCCAEEVDLDELLATRLVSFLMDHQQEIFQVPTYLQAAVQDHIAYMKTAQCKYPMEEMSAILPTYSYCKRITPQEFDEQRISASQAAVAELLENIIRDKTLSLKDKKKKLKQFQKEYPLIYQNRFPTTESEAILLENKPTIKQPMLSLRKPK
ncbi:DEP domain-containing protein 1A isoform B [Alligator mississippiensis]|uniref:DEP domain-containing protein 1A n=1 Tax=Alligator mississippiensis TaxID=8496 RepID=A0A151NJA3_ALLMI|nr:DEP domain-containing protein 1A isoform B [Alligator mississippiensis]